uniref:DDE Tnp4 domain-containing protein n=1 Tax=Nelumbo nucifera TaxID=4432 RepID=A0A822YIW9_NELNU|nr:TPA_asm: hypothetical protein HUJ06_010090 [Nelumbo nucifera]
MRVIAGVPSGVFNHRHSSLTNVVECAFGVLNKRWEILNATQHFDFDTQVKIVIVCYVLHNHIMEVDPHDRYTREGICEADRQNTSDGDEFVEESANVDSLALRLQRNELARWSTFRDQIE